MQRSFGLPQRSFGGAADFRRAALSAGKDSSCCRLCAFDSCGGGVCAYARFFYFRVSPGGKRGATHVVFSYSWIAPACARGLALRISSARILLLVVLSRHLSNSAGAVFRA